MSYGAALWKIHTKESVKKLRYCYHKCIKMFFGYSTFHVLTNDDVIAAICKLPEKQCATDPLPTNLLKDNVDVLAPFITELFNRSI